MKREFRGAAALCQVASDEFLAKFGKRRIYDALDAQRGLLFQASVVIKL